MVAMLRQISILFGFVGWLVPREGLSPRLYLSLINVLIGSRQSVYRHYREIKAADRRSRITDFIRALAAASGSGKASVPAVLFARLLRTIYLTEIVPRRQHAKMYGGPNPGFIDHPQFSYRDSLQSVIR